MAACFVTAVQYSTYAVVTHCGPAENDATCRYHRELKPDLAAPGRVIMLSLDLSTTTHWQRRRREYESSREELAMLLAASLHIAPELVEHGVYPSNDDIAVVFTEQGALEVSRNRQN